MALSKTGRLGRAAQAVWAEHRQALFVVSVGVVIWFAWVTFLWRFSACVPTLKPWIEMANGATWSDNWSVVSTRHPFWFALTVGTRTALNFLGPLAVIGSVAWLMFGGLERYMRMSLFEMVRMRDTELVSRLALVLRERGRDLAPDDLQAMHDEAERFEEEARPDLTGYTTSR